MFKPLLKCVGGKSKLIDVLNLELYKDYDNYIEPFIGGGALLFYLTPEKSIMSDSNTELINFYIQVRDNPIELLEWAKTFELSEESYYTIRDYDRKPGWFHEASSLFRAARFFFLNRTSFNGMWRTNKNGNMNVPYSKYKNITFPTKMRMLQASTYLKKVNILNVDFFDTLPFVNKSSFIYLDPPYLPYSPTANFTKYVKNDFTLVDHERLLDYCKRINNIGAKFLLSNSDTALTRYLFKDFNITSVGVYHSVGASSGSRLHKQEVIINNYK